MRKLLVKEAKRNYGKLIFYTVVTALLIGASVCVACCAVYFPDEAVRNMTRNDGASVALELENATEVDFKLLEQIPAAKIFATGSGLTYDVPLIAGGVNAELTEDMSARCCFFYADSGLFDKKYNDVYAIWISADVKPLLPILPEVVTLNGKQTVVVGVYNEQQAAEIGAASYGVVISRKFFDDFPNKKDLTFFCTLPVDENVVATVGALNKAGLKFKDENGYLQLANNIASIVVTLAAVAVLLAAVSFLLVESLFKLLILNRDAHIAMLYSLGATNGRISALYLTLSAGTATAALAFGTAIAAGLNAFCSYLFEFYLGSEQAVALQWYFVLGFAVLLAAACVLPVARLARRLKKSSAVAMFKEAGE